MRKKKTVRAAAASGDPQATLIAMLSTEHFVLQTAANATVSDAAARSSLYLLSLSSALVATGFASQSLDVFVPFLAIVLPGLFVLGLFTIVRLLDDVLENMWCLAGIARIRGYYRTVSPEAGEYFAARHGRWPERVPEPALWTGPLASFLTTSASMISFINSVVAGAGISLLAHYLVPGLGPAFLLLLGVLVAALLMVAFLSYQRRRTQSFLDRLGISAEFALK